MKWKNIVPLSLGLLTGVLSAISLLQYQALVMPSIAPDPEYSLGGTTFYFVSLLKRRDSEKTKQKGDGRINGNDDDRIEEWLSHEGNENMGRTKRENAEGEENGKEVTGLHGDLKDIGSGNAFDTSLDAQPSKDKTKILCMVALAGLDVATYATYSTTLQNTWGKHCSKVLFVSDRSIRVQANILRTDLKPGESHSWSRTKILLKEAYSFVEEFDWFVKVPYDGFVVLENLRHLLQLHQTNILGYIGQVFEGPGRDGSVFVLSRYAMELIVPTLITCTPRFLQGFDDGEVLESCLRNVDVISLTDGRDQSGIFRFQMKVPELELPRLATSRMQWNLKYIEHPERQDESCCEEYPVTFHAVDVKEMYTLEYAIYHLRPFGIGNYMCPSTSGLR
nr:glycoprotein-N-acetylgalactosamine 3-beta-galactosyltransferase 1-like [Lytechinus pictus]